MRDRDIDVIIASWVTFGIAAGTVVLRISTRCLRRALGWDDYLILPALALSFLGSFANLYQGSGRPIATLTPGDISAFRKWTVIAEVQNSIGLCLVKLSVCSLLLRMVKKTHSRLRRATHGLIAILIVVASVQVLLLLLQCRPLSAIWDENKAGNCFSIVVVYRDSYATGAINIVTDFYCVALPYFVVHGLQMARNLKISIYCLMGLALLLVVLHYAFAPDFTYYVYLPEIFALLEENIGITVANLPVLRPLFDSLHLSLRGHSWSLASLLHTFSHGPQPQSVLRSAEESDKDILVNGAAGQHDSMSLQAFGLTEAVSVPSRRGDLEESGGKL
ncbi:MAG: hypothetical protein Q9170_004673 [Blastenia crenularia]